MEAITTIAEKLGAFILALIVGLICWTRIEALEGRMNQVSVQESNEAKQIEERLRNIENRLSNVITASNSTVPSELTLTLDNEMKVVQNDLDWIKIVISEMYKTK